MLAWDPTERLLPEDALSHPYFNPISGKVGRQPSALQSLSVHEADLGPTEVTEFTCPDCGRRFSDWRSCQTHALSKRPPHARFCWYDRRRLPQCLNSRSYLQVLHEHSGHCDLKGRRKTIEDTHSIHLNGRREFYSILDGHSGNVASKFAASTLHEALQKELSQSLDCMDNLTTSIESSIKRAFLWVHDSFMRVAALERGIEKSGTTATSLFVDKQTKHLAVASLGDSRAVLSQWILLKRPGSSSSDQCDSLTRMSDNRCLVGRQLTKEYVGFIVNYTTHRVCALTDLARMLC
jgi:Protein phosphatase 2C